MSHRRAFEPWELTWTPESVTRFWDWHVDNVHFEPLFFSKRYSDAILREISHRIPLSGPVVDFGCGPGYLVEELLQRRVDTIGIDSAPQAVAKLTERCQGKPHFLGARTAVDGVIPLEDGAAGILLMVEVIEHLDDDTLTSVLGEVRRVVRLGGHVVCTTPNEENLELLKTVCPECGCVFHTVEHIRSLSASSLGELMRSAGFRGVVCYPTLFSRFGRHLRIAHRLAYALLRENLPHLLYIGVKA